MKRLVLASGILVLCSSVSVADTFPTLTVPPEFASYVSFSQSPSSMSMTGLTALLPGAAAIGSTGSLGDDYVLKATLQFDASNPTELGLAARGNLTGDFYGLSLNPTNGYLALTMVTDGTTSVDLASPVSVAGFNSATDYTLVFTVHGSTLSGQLLDGTTQVASLSAIDSTLASGLIGIVAFKPDDQSPTLVSGTWLNAEILAIPEPATLAQLISLAIVGGLIVWRRRRK